MGSVKYSLHMLRPFILVLAATICRHYLMKRLSSSDSRAEAMRALKRQVIKSIHRTMVADAKPVACEPSS